MRKLLLLSLIAALATVPVAPAGATPKPTVVLVHGAWDRATSWTDVAQRLRADGYVVVVPDNPLRSLAGDAAAIRRTLDAIAGPIVLVGHSYGGAVITNAATGDSDVKALVYISAFVPDRGESLATLGTHDVGSLIPLSIYTVPYIDASGAGLNIFINPLLFRTVFAADVAPARATAMARAQRPITLKAFTGASGPPAWRTIPSWYMVSRKDRAIPPATERYMAARARSHTVEVAASHAALVSRPREVSALIRSAAAAI